MTRIFFALVLAVLGAANCQAAQRTLRVFNWSDYIDPKVLDNFEKATGIQVVYDTYDSNELLEAKLMAGRSGYDLVAPSGTFLQRQIKLGIYQPLDRSRLKNASNISRDIDERLAAYDPGNRFAVNYMWFTTGIAFNVEKVKARLGSSALDSWDILFKPENARKLADCGIYLLDSPEDVFSVARRYLGLAPDAKHPGDLRRATDLIGRIRPMIRKFHSSEYIAALANGDICVALAWAGDAFQARNRAKEAGNNVVIDYVIPKEGTLISLDSFAIPKDAVNLDEAYEFLDYILRPEIAATNTAVTNFANGVEGSRHFIPKEISENPSIYPGVDLARRLFTVTPPEAELQRLITREWTRLKSGR